MYAEGCTLQRSLQVNADDTSAQEMMQQVMALYFCAEVIDFDTSQVAVLNMLVQVREFDALVEVMEFGTLLDRTLIQAAGHSL